MNTYNTILTDAGISKIINARANGSEVKLTKMAVGDGEMTPSQDMSSLISEKYRFDVSFVIPDKDNPNQLIVQGQIPVDIGGFDISEVALFTEDGTCFAVGNLPKTYKPQLEEGSAKELTIQVITEVSNAQDVEIYINNTISTDELNIFKAEIETIKNDIDTITTTLDTKVDKVDGMGLSSNDFTDEYKDKLTNLSSNFKTINGNDIVGTGDIQVQEVLESGTNIKTINGEDILGSGDIVIKGGSDLTAVSNMGIKYYNAEIAVAPGANKELPVFVKSNKPTNSIDDSQFLSTSRLLLKAGRTYKISGNLASSSNPDNTVTNDASADIFGRVFKVSDNTEVFNDKGGWVFAGTTFWNQYHIDFTFTYPEDTYLVMKSTYFDRFAGSPVFEVNVTEFSTSMEGIVDLNNLSTLSSPTLNTSIIPTSGLLLSDEVLTEKRHRITGKRLFERVFIVGVNSLSYNNTSAIAHNLTDLETIEIIDPIQISGIGGDAVTLPFTVMKGANGIQNIYINKTNININLGATDTYSKRPVFGTIQYTKTTDTADSPVRLVGSAHRSWYLEKTNSATISFPVSVDIPIPLDKIESGDIELNTNSGITIPEDGKWLLFIENTNHNFSRVIDIDFTIIINGLNSSRILGDSGADNGNVKGFTYSTVLDLKKNDTLDISMFHGDFTATTYNIMPGSVRLKIVSLATQNALSLANYYSKDEVDTKISEIGIESIDLSDYYTKEQIDETKQDLLVSGENLSTINGQSLLNGGDITINADSTDLQEQLDEIMEILPVERVLEITNSKAVSFEAKGSAHTWQKYNIPIVFDVITEEKYNNMTLTNGTIIVTDDCTVNLVFSGAVSLHESMNTGVELFLDVKVNGVSTGEVRSGNKPTGSSNGWTVNVPVNWTKTLDLKANDIISFTWSGYSQRDVGGGGGITNVAVSGVGLTLTTGQNFDFEEVLSRVEELENTKVNTADLVTINNQPLTGGGNIQVAKETALINMAIKYYNSNNVDITGLAVDTTISNIFMYDENSTNTINVDNFIESDTSKLILKAGRTYNINGEQLQSSDANTAPQTTAIITSINTGEIIQESVGYKFFPDAGKLWRQYPIELVITPTEDCYLTFVIKNKSVATGNINDNLFRCTITEYSPSTAGVVDMNNLSTLSSIKLNEEVLTEFRHIDGKPIYKYAQITQHLPSTASKTNIPITIPPDTEFLAIDTENSYVNQQAGGGDFNLKKDMFQFPFAGGDIDGYVIKNISVLSVTVGMNRSDCVILLTLKYTKKTDTADSPVRLVGSAQRQWYIEKTNSSSVSITSGSTVNMNLTTVKNGDTELSNNTGFIIPEDGLWNIDYNFNVTRNKSTDQNMLNILVNGIQIRQTAHEYNTLSGEAVLSYSESFQLKKGDIVTFSMTSWGQTTTYPIGSISAKLYNISTQNAVSLANYYTKEEINNKLPNIEQSTLISPNGTKYQLGVADDGSLTTTLIN